MFERFNEHARRSLFFARYEAASADGRLIASEHMLLGLLREADEALEEVLNACGVDLDELRDELVGENTPVQRPASSVDLPLSNEVKRALTYAVREAEGMGHDSVGTEHILIGLMRVEGCLAEQYLSDHGLELYQLKHEVQRYVHDVEMAARTGETPHLIEYARDLTQMAADGLFDPLIGREIELDRIIQILCRRTKNNPLLLGEAGVGKTAIVEGLAAKIVEGHVPALLAERRIVALDLSLLVAGTKYRGQFEERLKGLLRELQEHPEVIVFIDEIHSLIGTGSAEGSLDAANILKPALSRGEITCIGSTTMQEYRKYVEKDRALSRRFQVIAIRQPTEEETVEILRGVKSRYEEFHGVRYTEPALMAAAAHSGRYITDRAFPDKAIDVLDEAGARVKLRHAGSTASLRAVQLEMKRLVSQMKEAISEKSFDRAVALREEELRLREELEMLEQTQERASGSIAEVTRSDIEDVVSSWTGIPVTSLEEDEADRLQRMEDILRQRIVGQDRAIEALARAIRRSRLGLTNPQRPIGSFIFLGPSGVGKTEVAKQLARFLFHDPRHLIRFDMSEYMEKHTVSRLIGSPPGYVGFEEGGQLSEQIRRNPYSVVLLDEIEKAHPDIYNLLLQVLEDGRLTDNYGNVVDFTNTIIIMTSNLGSRSLITNGRVGFGGEGTVPEAAEVHEIVDRELRRHFSPEFLDRLDDVIVFDPLDHDSLLGVAHLLLEETRTYLKGRSVSLRFDPNLAAWLVGKAGIDQRTGARPLRRLVQLWIEDAVADYLIRHRGEEEHRLYIRIKDHMPALETLDAVARVQEAP